VTAEYITRTYRRKRKERNSKHGETGGDNFSKPRLRYDISVAYCRNGNLKNTDSPLASA